MMRGFGVATIAETSLSTIAVGERGWPRQMLRGRNRLFALQGGQDVRHRTLGHTGLIVSEVALGSMQFGGQMNMGNLGQDETNRMVKHALDRGINFIDTADVYSRGESETLLGNALKGIRQEMEGSPWDPVGQLNGSP